MRHNTLQLTILIAISLTLGPAARAATHAAEKEKVTYLGVAISPVEQSLRKHFKLEAGTAVLVEFVDGDSPAAEAGVEKHDILTRLNDQILVNPHQLHVLVRMHKPGQTVKLSLIRQGKPLTVSAKLIEKEVVVDDWPEDLSRSMRRLHRDLPNIEWDRKLTLKDPKGEVIFSWPPPEMKKHIDEMQKKLEELPGKTRKQVESWMRQHAMHDRPRHGRGTVSAMQISFSDGEHRLTFTAQDGRKHLTVTDKDGEVLYTGPPADEEKLQKLSPDVRTKVEHFRKGLRSDAGRIFLKSADDDRDSLDAKSIEIRLGADRD